MAPEQIFLLLLGFASVIGTILGAFNKIHREFSEAQKAVGEKYIKTKDLEEIVGHKGEILSIKEILEKLDRQDQKFAHDLDVLMCHDATLQDHAKMIAEEQAHDDRQDMEMRMILKALLAVLRSLEQKGINHTTTANIKEIEAYIWKTEKQ